MTSEELLRARRAFWEMCCAQIPTSDQYTFCAVTAAELADAKLLEWDRRWGVGANYHPETSNSRADTDHRSPCPW